MLDARDLWRLLPPSTTGTYSLYSPPLRNGLNHTNQSYSGHQVSQVTIYHHLKEDFVLNLKRNKVALIVLSIMKIIKY